MPVAAGATLCRTHRRLRVFSSIGPLEIILVLVVLLVIFGPKRLPVARQVARHAACASSRTRSRGDDKDDEETDADRASRPHAAQADAATRLRRRPRRPSRPRPARLIRAQRRRDRMATTLKPIGHEDRLTLVDHLDELRTRLIICAITLVVAFGLCFWQNQRAARRPQQAARRTARRPPRTARATAGSPASRPAQVEVAARASRRRASRRSQRWRRRDNLTPVQSKTVAGGRSRQTADAARALPRPTPERVPITIGVGEPFTVTLRSRRTSRCCSRCRSCSTRRTRSCCRRSAPRAAARAAADADGPGAVHRRGRVRLLPRAAARDLVPAELQHHELRRPDPGQGLLPLLELLALLSTGLVFQLPVGLLALNAVGIINARQLRANWRYAIVAIAVIAAILPGVDPVTTMILMVPLLGAVPPEYPAPDDRRSAAGGPRRDHGVHAARRRRDRGNLREMLFDLQSRGKLKDVESNGKFTSHNPSSPENIKL